MKQKTLIATGIAFALVLTFSLSRSQAQIGNAPGPAPVAPIPPPVQKFPPPRARHPRQLIMRTLSELRVVKTELQRSQDDFAGHKDSAIEACNKAMLELEAVMRAMPPPPSPHQMPPPSATATPPPSTAPPTAPSAPPAQPQQ